MNPGPINTFAGVIFQYMPVNLQGLISPNDFMLASAIAGILSAFMIGLIWSKGL